MYDTVTAYDELEYKLLEIYDMYLRFYCPTKIQKIKKERGLKHPFPHRRLLIHRNYY